MEVEESENELLKCQLGECRCGLDDLFQCAGQAIMVEHVL